MNNKLLFILLMTMLCGHGAVQADRDIQVIRSFITSLELPYLSAGQVEHIAQSIVRYGQQYAVDPLLVTALMYRESTFNPCAVSKTGAQGLGQIKSLNFPDLEITNAFDIEQNTRGTAQYLKQMLSLWQNNPKQVEYALASYFKGYSGFKREMDDKKALGYVASIVAKYQEVMQFKKEMNS